MKNFVKDAIGHYEVLLDHTQRDYEPHPIHVWKRMVVPLCNDFERIIKNGTKNDAWQTIEGIVRACSNLKDK